MRFWWVNQNQTFEQETLGGYLWSPKRNANRARNPFYEFMREVAPGDLVLSFQGTFIRAIGVAQSYAYESPKPAEFGSAGAYWDLIGWRVDVRFNPLSNQIRPVDHMADIAPVLPTRYTPLLKDGRGLQSVYLTAVPPALMAVLAAKIGREAQMLMDSRLYQDAEHEAKRNGLVEWEEHLRKEVEANDSIPATEREQVVLARIGQGRFKANVQRIETHCRITGVSWLEHLRASHILPWRDCPTNETRLDGENGFLLTPTVDHLFDRGFISFEDDGRLLISPVAHQASLQRMGIPEAGFRTGTLTSGQRDYLARHRDGVFLQASVRS
jgi:putative restriction endonuclease